MLNFILHKMLNKKWMILSLLIGNILLISIASSCALYENAIMQKMLTSDLASYIQEENKFPGVTVMRADVKEISAKTDYERYLEMKPVADGYAERLGVKEAYHITHYYRTVNVVSSIASASAANEEIRMALGAYNDFEEHIQITAGSMYGDTVDNNVIEVIIPKRTMVSRNLMVGETLNIKSLKDADDESYTLKIVGVFEPTDDTDLYWYSSPSNWIQTCIMNYNTFEELFMNDELEKKVFTVEWVSIVDYKDYKGTEASYILEETLAVEDQFNSKFPSGFTANYKDIFSNYEVEAAKLKVTLLVLQIPIFVLLAAFIFMVSRQMLEMEQNEISIYKSRGASKKQIITLYFLQSVLLTAIALVISIPLGYFICQVIGSANAFLEFVNRSALPVSITGTMWLYALAASLVSIGTMVIPVFRYADVSIVAHKQKKAKKSETPMWQKLCLDLILLAVALYGYYLYNQNAEYLSMNMGSGSAMGPVLYLSSSVFILGAGLLVLRIFPWLVKLIFFIGRRFWSPALYASFLRIMRAKSNQGFMMVFLIMTMSLGIFNAQAARTINENGEEKIRYSNGADLVIKEVWESGSGLAAGGSVSYTEPEYGKYSTLEGVESTTKVFRGQVNMVAEGVKMNGVQIMGINTKEFGEIAWFKDGLLPTHWYNYLNAMSQNSEAVLLSANFADTGIKIGDVITYTSKYGTTRGIVYGFVDYWPGYVPQELIVDIHGVAAMVDHHLIISSFDQLQSQWGVQPYEVWMKVPGSTQFIYDWAAENNIKFSEFKDTKADLISWKNNPVTQGTNGVLTVGFIVVLILCATGFLIFWILSIQSRVLQFGIFRAMGMSMKEILGMLGNEQLFISGISIAMGTVIGKIASTLFVPMIQLAYSTAETIIPLEIANATGDYIRLFIVIGLVVASCMGILSALISKIKISQALKLGED